MPNRMANHLAGLWALSLLGPTLVAVPLFGQQNALPTTHPAANGSASLMNEAMADYSSFEYESCIAKLKRLLEANPQDASPRLLRALAHGRLAVRHETDARRYKGMLSPQKAEAQRLLEAATEEDHSAAEEYRQMKQDLDDLLGRRLTSDYAITQLINGVVRTKLAGYAAGSYEERVLAREEFLEQARQAFDAYLHPPAGSVFPKPEGLNRIQGEFFLGVVVYRQALRPAQREGDPDQLAHAGKLGEAENVMTRLLDPSSESYVEKSLPATMPDRAALVQRWKSYPSLYLGLIRTWQGSDDALLGRNSAARKTYEQARQDFLDAKRLDTDEKGASRSGLIADLVAGPDGNGGQLKEVERAEAQIPPYTNDLMLEWRSAFGYDSNVILLGQNTSVPRNVGEKDSDVRAWSGLGLSYTLDLGRIDPKLDRWSLGLLGRASGNWNGSIHDYNEQLYSGSAAIQYEILEPWHGDNAVQGPLYGSIQYDYEDFMLGNQGFLSNNRITPRLTLYTFDNRNISSFEFRYEDRNYLERLRDLRFDRDGNYWAFRLSQAFGVLDMTKFYKNLNWQPWGLAGDPTDPEKFDPSNPKQDTTGYQRWLRPYVGFEYGWDSTTGQEYDTNRYLTFAGIEVPLPYGVLFNSGGEWAWEDYYHRGSLVDFHRRAREDFIQTYSFGLERRFVLVPGNRQNRFEPKIDRLVMTIRGDIRFTNDDSNVEDRMDEAIFSYDRAIYGLSVSFQFN
jgi:hypothetical protein